MLGITKKVREVTGASPDSIPANILISNEPVILRGLVKDWPIVQAGLRSNQEANAYIRKFYTDKPVIEYCGAPEMAGRYFYNDDFSAFNYDSQRVSMNFVLDKLIQHEADSNPPTFYVGSTDVDIFLPGFRAENDLGLAEQKPTVSIWIGNQSRIPAHWDAPENIACCVIGKRRFTLFPPQQIENLYVGPLDHTPAGQSISLVDFAQPDFEKFPRFRTAIEHGMVAELEPGDALFLPSMWWHHVEGLSNFNALVNYWWRTAPAYMGAGINVLKHAMLSIRDLPEKEKAAWKSLFDYYIFGAADQAAQPIPESAQGVLGPMDELNARQLRAWLVNRLNR